MWAAMPRRVRKGDEFIPTSVLKQLAQSRLPLDKETYIARLNELLNRS